MKPTLSGLALALATLMALSPTWTPAARAASPGADFSATKNPNGVWSYGYIPAIGGALSLYTTPANVDGLTGWNNSGDGTNAPPEVLYNGTASAITYLTLTMESGEFTLHPGANGELSVVRYTAPAAGQYAATGFFYGRDVDGTTTDVHLLVNGVSIFDGAVDGYGLGTGPGFSKSVTLKAGDTLDFAVGYGANGNYFDDTTALVAYVSQGPAQPVVTVVSPPAGITLPAGAALLPLAASVADPAGDLASVQFLVDGTPLGAALTTAPYVLNATAPSVPGAHTIEAVATDAQGRQSTDSVTINTVAASAFPLTPALLTPVNGLNLAAGSTLTLTGTSDAISSVAIYADGQRVAFVGGPPTANGEARTPAVHRDDASPSPVVNTFSTNFTLPGTDKLLSLIVVAIDQLGVSSVSGVSSVHSTVTTDQAPQVAITNLAATALVAVGSVNTVDVSASDPDAVAAQAEAHGLVAQDSTLDGVLSKLAFYVNGGLINLLSMPSATSNFTFSPPASGKYVLHSVATDGSGLSTVSEPVVVTVPASPVVTVMAAGDGMAVEGGENGKVLVLRAGDTSLPLTVAYKAKGSAVKNVDYRPPSGTVTIPAGASKAKIKIKPLDNPESGTRKVKVRLLPATDGSYTVGNPAVAKIKVIDEN